MPFFKHFSRTRPFSRRVYLDYASSTPRDFVMQKLFPKIPEGLLSANPSALHREGVALHRYLDDARKRCADVLEVHSDEIIFTSGATESDNLAILGSIYAFLKSGISHGEIAVFSSDLEHSAVKESIDIATNFSVRHISLIAEGGVINPKDIVVPEGVKAVIVSVMYVNNEIGTIQPIVEIAKRIRKLRKDHPDVQFIFHTDGTQAPLHFTLRVPTLGVDMITLGATKLYCQKGVGLLYKKRNIKLEPIIHGGGQEMGLRPGTEPVGLIHEFAHSLAYAKDMRDKETTRVRELQSYFESEIEKNFSQIKVTAKSSPRTPHITHIAAAGFDSELLVLELDARGIAVSAKSACRNDNDESELVTKLYGNDFGAIRFSFGRMTTKNDLNKALEALKSIFQKYQK